MLLFCIVLALPVALAGTVERSFSDNDINPLETITISLDVTIDGAIVYTLVEQIPAGWTIIDSGTGTIQPSGEEIRWIEFSPEDTVLEYLVQAPVSGGSYFFEGTVAFDDNPQQEIIGETQVDVSGEDTTPPIITDIQATPSYTSAGISWTTNENSDSRVYYGETQDLGSEESETNLVTYHSINLENLNENTIYYYKVESCDASENCDDSTINTFTTLETEQEQTDDLMVNYIRGIITLNNNPAVAGTDYQVEVLSGVNQGFIYQGTVDSNIPEDMQGNGYYDTLDRIGFLTGDSFRVRLIGYTCIDGDEEGVFENGGNGDFNTQEGLVNINCIVSQNSPPVLEDIPDQFLDEDQTISIILSAADPDEDELFFEVIDEDENQVNCELDGTILTFIPFPDWNGDATCEIQVTDGKLTDSKTVNIEVFPINDRPIFQENIPHITWNQDTDLIDYINLNNYFFDVDVEELDYEIIGGHNPINIVIAENGLVSFYPGEGFYGTRNIIFKASDSNFFVLSNAISLTVTKVGDPPEFGQMDCITEIDEDMEYSCELIATDPNDDEFTFRIVEEDNLNCYIQEDTLTYVSAQDYNGPASCLIRVEDVDGYNDFLFEVNVWPVNDAPVLDPINDITANEGEMVEIIATANDVENDILNYEINDTRFTDHGAGRFSWQTTYEDSGIHYVEITVTDGNTGTDTQTVKIILNNQNEQPIFYSIPEISIQEDSEFQIVIEDLIEYAHDNDGYIDRFEIVGEHINKVDCSIVDYSLGVRSALDFSGQASCIIRVYDNENGFDETTLNINVLHVNDAPVIESYTPPQNPIITEDGLQDFTILWSDVDNPEEVLIQWFVDDIPEDIGESYQFTATNTGQFDIKVIVSDSIDFVFYIWNLIATNIPIVDSYTGETTDFSGMDDDDLSSVDLVLEKEYGKIEFLESVDLRDTVDFENYADILDSLVAIDTDYLTALKNIPARITLYNLDFEEMPTIYNDREFTLDYNEVIGICSLNLCSNRDYNSETGTLSFEVLGFSSFKAGNILSCSAQGGNICSENKICDGELLSAIEDNCCSTTCSKRPLEFSDIYRCEQENLNKNIEINIRNPDSGDEFKPGEVIDIELKIRNNLEEDLEFDIEVYLYDVTEEDRVDDDDYSIDIDESDSEKIEFEFEVPEDIDEKNDYAIFVKVMDEDEEYCNEEYVSVDIEREKHDVIIEDILITTGDVICGDKISLETKIRNRGSRDEDIFLMIENSELGILEKSDEFEIERYDEDDEAKEIFTIKIPNNAGKGEYKIKATVFFDDGKGEHVLFKDLILGSCREYNREIVTNGPIILGNPISDQVVKKPTFIEKLANIFSPSESGTLNIINIALIFGIILCVVIIIVVGILRRK